MHWEYPMIARAAAAKKPEPKQRQRDENHPLSGELIEEQPQRRRSEQNLRQASDDPSVRNYLSSSVSFCTRLMNWDTCLGSK